MLALILQVFAPFAYAVASDSDQGFEYQLICTADGIKQIPIDTTGAPIEPRDNVSCAFCVLHATPILHAPQFSVVGVGEARRDHPQFLRPVHQVQTSIWHGRLHFTRAPPRIV